MAETTASEHRIDIETGVRRVRVEFDGTTVADSTSALTLLETGKPPRYYLPRADVRLDLLVPTEKVTHCPYKGDAEYWSVRTGEALHENVAWSYPTPIPQSEAIAGLICFYSERVDEYVDGAPS